MKRHFPVQSPGDLIPKNRKKVKRVLHRDLLDDMAPATEDDQAEKMEEVDEGTKPM